MININTSILFCTYSMNLEGMLQQAQIYIICFNKHIMELFKIKTFKRTLLFKQKLCNHNCCYGNAWNLVFTDFLTTKFHKFVQQLLKWKDLLKHFDFEMTLCPARLVYNSYNVHITSYNVRLLFHYNTKFPFMV